MKNDGDDDENENDDDDYYMIIIATDMNSIKQTINMRKITEIQM